LKTVTVVAGQTIELGYQYDNYATEVVFPSDIVTPFITNFGSSGIFAIWYRRSGDSLGYPIGGPLVTFDSSNNTITWQVVEADTANPGTAQVQLRYIIDEVCVMSQMFTGVVSDSVDVGTTVPEPMEQWADAIITLSSGGQPTVITSSSAMTNNSAIYLYMGSESGYTYNHVYYWDGTSWKDSGAYGGGTGAGRLWSAQDIYLFQQLLAHLKYDSAPAGTIAEELIASLENKPTDQGWSTEQIDMLDNLLSHVKYTDADGGDFADDLIASLRGQTTTYTDADEVEY